MLLLTIQACVRACTCIQFALWITSTFANGLYYRVFPSGTLRGNAYKSLCSQKSSNVPIGTFLLGTLGVPKKNTRCSQWEQRAFPKRTVSVPKRNVPSVPTCETLPKLDTLITLVQFKLSQTVKNLMQLPCYIWQ